MFLLLVQNTERIATGCQDGLLRIYDTCKPEASPLEIRVSPNKVDESITKIAWLDTNVLFVGKRNGVVESRDVRVDPETGPLASTTLTANMTVQDIEISHNHKVLITACGTKVSLMKSYKSSYPHGVVNFLNSIAIYFVRRYFSRWDFCLCQTWRWSATSRSPLRCTSARKVGRRSPRMAASFLR